MMREPERIANCAICGLPPHPGESCVQYAHPPVTFTSLFRPGDYVFIDGDKGSRAAVTAIIFRDRGFHIVECSWVHNGGELVHRIEPWRLAKV